MSRLFPVPSYEKSGSDINVILVIEDSTIPTITEIHSIFYNAIQVFENEGYDCGEINTWVYVVDLNSELGHKYWYDLKKKYLEMDFKLLMIYESKGDKDARFDNNIKVVVGLWLMMFNQCGFDIYIDDVNETVYMHQPPGFVDKAYYNHVCENFAKPSLIRVWYDCI